MKDTFRELFPEAAVYGGEGAYVLWMDLRRVFASEDEMQDFFCRKAFFHVDSGSAYGAPGFARMCVASPVHCVQNAMDDLRKAWKARV